MTNLKLLLLSIIIQGLMFVIVHAFLYIRMRVCFEVFQFQTAVVALKPFFLLLSAISKNTENVSVPQILIKFIHTTSHPLHTKKLPILF